MTEETKQPVDPSNINLLDWKRGWDEATDTIIRTLKDAAGKAYAGSEAENAALLMSVATSLEGQTKGHSAQVVKAEQERRDMAAAAAVAENGSAKKKTRRKTKKKPTA